MSDKESAKTGYQRERIDKEPKGFFVLPAVDELKASAFNWFIEAEREALPGESETITNNELVKRKADVMASFINQFGEWEFGDFTYGKYQADPPVSFVYWLAGQIQPYFNEVTDPKDSAVS